jgi:hypothetical protein
MRRQMRMSPVSKRSEITKDDHAESIAVKYYHKNVNYTIRLFKHNYCRYTASYFQIKSIYMTEEPTTIHRL